MKKTISVILKDEGLLIVSGITLSALILRIIFLAVNPPLIDADEAVVGLMAKNIANGNDFPFYFWGQHYMGALEAFCVAFFYKIAGPSVFWLKLVPALFWYLSIPIMYLLWRQVSDRPVALSAALLTIFPGYFLSEWISKARGGYSEIVFLGALVLYLYSTYENHVNKKLLLFIIGVLNSIAFWVNAQSISFIMPIAVHYVLSEKYDLKTYFIRMLQIFSGFSPMLLALAYYDLTHELGFLSFLLRGHKETYFLTRITSNVANLFSDAFPVLIGSYYPWTHDIILPIVSYLVYVAFLISLVYFGYNIFRKRVNLKESKWLFFWSFVLLLTYYVISRFGALIPREPRYLITAIFFIPFCISYFFYSLYKRSRFFAALVIVVLFSSNLFCSYIYYTHKSPPVFQQLSEYLEKRKITIIFSDYWILMNLIFYSDEKIVGSSNLGPDINDRYAKYGESLCRAQPENIAFVIGQPEYGDTVINGLKAAGISYNLNSYIGFMVIDGFTSDPRNIKIASVEKTCKKQK